MKQISLHAALSLEGNTKEMVLPGKPMSNMKLQADFRVVYCEATPDSADISPIAQDLVGVCGLGNRRVV